MSSPGRDYAADQRTQRRQARGLRAATVTRIVLTSADDSPTSMCSMKAVTTPRLVQGLDKASSRWLAALVMRRLSGASNLMFERRRRACAAMVSRCSSSTLA